jgi:hypothetical protein
MVSDLDGGGITSIRRSHSQNQLNKPSNDLFGLTLHPIDIDPVVPPPLKTVDNNGDQNQEAKDTVGVSDLASSLMKATLNNSANLDTSNNATDASNTSREVQDILGDFNPGSGAPALPPKQNPSAPGINRPSSVQREKISSSLIALPRPPSRMGPTVARPRASPSPALGSSPMESSTSSVFSAGTLRRLSRQESAVAATESPSRKGSSETNFELMKTPSFGLSRGPSPLTLGMSDVVPLAVAFQEVCHACFNGAEETQCQVRLIGDMMISFPAGIVQVVAYNPNPAQLSFKIKNASVFESIVPNSQLITQSDLLSTPDGKVFEFKMEALKDLLKVQAEQNPNAAYFNIDLLKYQV